jgi:uncharacterized membrane protein YgaE (UPF0421/DUF939 family)
MSNLTRSQREQRAFNLVVASGIGSVVSVVLIVLWVFGAVGFGLVFLVAMVTAVCSVLARRTLRS